MPIFHANELNFADKKLIVLFQGAPGTGKSTLGFSAPDVLNIDIDRGVSRVKPEHRKDTSVCANFDEVKADVEAAKGKYKTIVIDTGGALVEMLKQYVVDNPKDFKGGTKATGGISLQGFGFVKQLWNDFTADLRKHFNVVFLFHENAVRNGDDGTFYELVCEGSQRTTVYQSCDLAARLFIQNGQRYLGFTPTEQYSAKACYGIKGLVPVPELKEGEPNTFLTDLFATIRKNLEEESKTLAPQYAQYNEVMEAAKRVCSEMTKLEDVKGTMEMIQNLPHVLTSKKESKAMFKKRLDELGIVYNKDADTYEYKAK